MDKLRKLIRVLLPHSLRRILSNIKHRVVYPIHLMKAKKKIILSRPLKDKRDKICFEVDLAEHCNLNCRGCSDFSCIAKPKFADIDEFRRDFARMGEIFGHECERIYLLGGEPLLNPEIISFMKIARENFTKGNIFVFTNGILLARKDSDFWQACRDNDIGILISAYPIKIDIDTIMEKAKNFGVSVKWAWDRNANEQDIFSVCAINFAGNSNIKLNFAMCSQANQCITLKHGKLYTCSFAPHVFTFNNRFNKNILITEEDYIDIYKNVNAEEILQKLSEPIPACRYCTTSHYVRTVKWSRSKGEISEWM